MQYNHNNKWLNGVLCCVYVCVSHTRLLAWCVATAVPLANYATDYMDESKWPRPPIVPVPQPKAQQAVPVQLDSSIL